VLRAVREICCVTAVLALSASAAPAQAAIGPAETRLIASKLSVLSIAVATGPEGVNFLSKFLPCARRGVVDYRNTRAGRRATFSGCDAGDGVTVDGGAELRWRGPGLSRNRRHFRKLKLAGAITVTVAGAATTQMRRMTVEGIAFRGRKRSLKRLNRRSLRVTLFGRRVKVDKRGSPRRIFEPRGLNIDTIPNPSNSLAALTEADVKRIAYDPALALYAILDTATDAGVEGTNRTPYGSVHVAPNPANSTVHLDYVLHALPIEGAIFIDGAFSQDWTDLSDTRIAMAVQGQITLGGGVPRITLDRLEWGLGGGAPDPSQIRISGRLVAGSQVRAFAFDLVVND
jgi:hypothetical protein